MLTAAVVAGLEEVAGAALAAATTLAALIGVDFFAALTAGIDVADAVAAAVLGTDTAAAAALSAAECAAFDAAFVRVDGRVDASCGRTDFD